MRENEEHLRRLKDDPDLTIRTIGIVIIKENIAEKLKEISALDMLKNKIPVGECIMRYEDPEGRRFYALDTHKLVSYHRRHELRDIVFQQQEAWEVLPLERRNQIEADYDSGRRRIRTWLASHPYQDYLRSKQLGKIFEEADKIAYPK